MTARTDPFVPGPHRLFAVEPADGVRFEVVAADGAVVVRVGDLAAATIAAAAVAARRSQPVWVVAPDRWAASITRTGVGWRAANCGQRAAPLAAIERVLSHLPNPKEQP